MLIGFPSAHIPALKPLCAQIENVQLCRPLVVKSNNTHRGRRKQQLRQLSQRLSTFSRNKNVCRETDLEDAGITKKKRRNPHSQQRLPDNDAWPQIKVLVDDVEQLCLCFLGGTVGEQGDGQRMGHPDGIRHL